MAFRIDKYTTYIEGYGDFEVEIKLDRETKMFSTEIPTPVDEDELPRLAYLYNETWKGLSEEINQKITEFELFEKEPELVIVYNFTEHRDYRDGAGIGMTFMWGVYEKIVHRGKNHYKWKRGDKFSKKLQPVWHSNFQDYKEVAHSSVREEFFNTVVEALEVLRKKLYYFLSASDIQDYSEEELKLWLENQSSSEYKRLVT